LKNQASKGSLNILMQPAENEESKESPSVSQNQSKQSKQSKQESPVVVMSSPEIDINDSLQARVN
jgi:hypothetical protein